MAKRGCEERDERQRKRMWRLAERRWRLLRGVTACLLIVLAMAALCLTRPVRGSASAVDHNVCDTERGITSDVTSMGRNGYVAVVSALGDTCHAMLDWPLREPIGMLRAYDGPAQPWLSGHRGVDLRAGAGEDLLAPGDGVISFAGKVAGKDVVSIRHGGLVLTFEPAVTDIDVGASVRRGQNFAKVGEGSDHCDDVCLHWGVRDGEKTYLNPASMVSPYRIVLKPGR